MPKRLIVVLGSILAGLLLTGCFALRGFSWSKSSIRVGEKTVALLSLFPASAGLGATDYPFILVGLPQDRKDASSSLTVANPKVFDSVGRFGGPFALQADPSIATVATTPGSNSCQRDGIDAADLTDHLWFAYRTNGTVRDRRQIAREALTKLGIKAKNDATGGTKDVVFISGAWTDNSTKEPDGVVQASELDCTGLMFTSLPVRPPPD